jgi:hypothetical protein
MSATTPTPFVYVARDISEVSRFLRLHSFELLIFAVMAVLLAICLASAPLLMPQGGRAATGGAAARLAGERPRGPGKAART